MRTGVLSADANRRAGLQRKANDVIRPGKICARLVGANAKGWAVDLMLAFEAGQKIIEQKLTSNINTPHFKISATT
jgi:hypothetical protein